MISEKNTNNSPRLKQKKTFDDEEGLIQNLKVDLLDYLKNKRIELSEKNSNPEKIYNVLTLEVINVLHNLLLFGMIQVNNSKKEQQNNNPFRTMKKGSAKNFGLNFFQKSEKEKKDIDVLVENLAAFLEYDQSYFNALNEMEIQRSNHFTKFKGGGGRGEGEGRGGRGKREEMGMGMSFYKLKRGGGGGGE